MNKVILMGRLTREPDVRVAGNGSDGLVIARFTLAVDRRRTTQDGQREADFISCVAFGKVAEFVQRYLHTGTKIAVNGRIQTGSYVKQDGQKVYTTEVVADEIEFAESKAAADVRFGNQQRDGYQGRPQYPNPAPNPNPNQYPYQNPYQNQIPVPYPNQNPYQGQSVMAPGVPQVPQYGQYREAPVNQGFMQQPNPQMPVQGAMPEAPKAPVEAAPVRVPEAPVMPAPEPVTEAPCAIEAEAETKAGTEPAAEEKFMPAPEEAVAEEAVREQETPEEIEAGSEVGQGFMNIVEGVEDESLPFN